MNFASYCIHTVSSEPFLSYTHVSELDELSDKNLDIKPKWIAVLYTYIVFSVKLWGKIIHKY